MSKEATYLITVGVLLSVSLGLFGLILAKPSPYPCATIACLIERNAP